MRKNHLNVNVSSKRFSSLPVNPTEMRKASSFTCFSLVPLSEMAGENSTGILPLWHHKGYWYLRLGTLCQVSVLLLPPFLNSTTKHQFEQEANVCFSDGYKQRAKKMLFSGDLLSFLGVLTHATLVKRQEEFWKWVRKSVVKYIKEIIQESGHTMSHLLLQQGVERAEPLRRRDVLRAYFWVRTNVKEKEEKKSHVASEPRMYVTLWTHYFTFRHLLGLLTVVGVNHYGGRHAETFSLFLQHVHSSRWDTLSPAWNFTPYCQTLLN